MLLTGVGRLLGLISLLFRKKALSIVSDMGNSTQKLFRGSADAAKVDLLPDRVGNACFKHPDLKWNLWQW